MKHVQAARLVSAEIHIFAISSSTEQGFGSVTGSASGPASGSASGSAIEASAMVKWTEMLL